VAGTFGGQFLLWEYAIAIAGRIIGNQSFDQPNVEAANVQARALLDTPLGSSPAAPSLPYGAVTFTTANFDAADATSLDVVLAAFLSHASSHGYVSIQAYVDRYTDSAALA
jgi:glucose-6-phosphate isomerase